MSCSSRFCRRTSNVALLLCCVLALSRCKSSSNSDGAARSASPIGSSSAPKKSANLLQAELRRDPNGVPEDELTAPEVPRRLAAARALARIADDRSFAALEKALADEAPSVIAWAAFGVGQLCRGHEPEAVRHLALRAASLAAQTQDDERDRSIGSIAWALGRCASDEAEKTLRSWLKLRAAIAMPASLALGQVARARQHLDDASVAALLDAAAKAPDSAALFPIESLPALGAAAKARLLEVASKALASPSRGRAFAVRALAKAGPEAAPALRDFVESASATDAERADAARALAALGNGGQSELAAALTSQARSLIDQERWLTSQHGVVLTLLESLEPKSADAGVLNELAQLPLAGEPPPVARRKIMLRCRAAALLANRASANATLLSCDPSPAAERREGSLGLIKVLGRGPLDRERGPRFQELARSEDRVVREAALELLMAHDEIPNTSELLALALSSSAAGVRATAAKVLARYPARAQGSPAKSDATDVAAPSATPPDPRVIQALTQQLAEVGTSNNIELSSWLLDAASALELLGAKPALERACASANPTLRQHAEKGFALLGDAKHRCPSVTGTDTWSGNATGNFRLDFETDVGPLSITLWDDYSPFATARFVELARAGFYDGMLIHRVVPGFVVQLGDPDGDGFSGANLPPLRCQLSDETFALGSVGVALAGRDTGLSQFFVTLREAPHLSGEYSLIGQAGPGWERLAAGDRILKVRVLEAGAK